MMTLINATSGMKIKKNFIVVSHQEKRLNLPWTERGRVREKERGVEKYLINSKASKMMERDIFKHEKKRRKKEGEEVFH